MIIPNLLGSICTGKLGSVYSGQVGSVSGEEMGSVLSEFPISSQLNQEFKRAIL